MKSIRNNIFTTWPLYLSVFLLILNDHFLKQNYPGWVTGKLSDFSGIFLIILFLRAIYPEHTKKITISIVIIFSCWKSELSQILIDGINSFSYFKIERVIDYSDLIAFVMIPIAHFIFDHKQRFKIKLNIIEYLRIPIFILTIFAITATSIHTPFHKYTIRKESKEQKIDRIKAISVISEVARHHNLLCEKCDANESAGIFKNTEIVLKYTFLLNNRGVEFEITGKSGGLIFGESSLEEMDRIKRSLQDFLSYKFKNLEFVIKLSDER